MQKRQIENLRKRLRNVQHILFNKARRHAVLFMDFHEHCKMHTVLALKEDLHRWDNSLRWKSSSFTYLSLWLMVTVTTWSTRPARTLSQACRVDTKGNRQNSSHQFPLPVDTYLCWSFICVCFFTLPWFSIWAKLAKQICLLLILALPSLVGLCLSSLLCVSSFSHSWSQEHPISMGALGWGRGVFSVWGRNIARWEFFQSSDQEF